MLMTMLLFSCADERQDDRDREEAGAGRACRRRPASAHCPATGAGGQAHASHQGPVKVILVTHTHTNNYYLSVICYFVWSPLFLPTPTPFLPPSFHYLIHAMRNKIIIQIQHKKIFSLLAEIGRKEIIERECASLLNFGAAIICRMLPPRGRPFATFLDGLGPAQKKVKHTSSASPFWLFSTFPLLEESQPHSLLLAPSSSSSVPPRQLPSAHHSRDPRDLDLVSKSRDEREMRIWSNPHLEKQSRLQV